MASISIIIPTYNNFPQLKQCLASIQRLHLPTSQIQIIVVNNACDSKLTSKLICLYPFTSVSLHLHTPPSRRRSTLSHLVLIPHHNLGYVQSINLATRYSVGKFLLFTNDDLEFSSDCVTKLYQYAISHPDSGIVGAYQYSKRDHATPTCLGQTFHPWTGIISNNPPRTIPHPVQFVTGSCLLISKKLFTRLGLFPDVYSPGMFEDLHLSTLASRLGYHPTLLPDAICYHDPATTFNRKPIQKYFFWYKNKFIYLRLCYSWYHVLSVFIIQYVLITPLRSVLFRDGRFKPALQALTWHLAHPHLSV